MFIFFIVIASSLGRGGAIGHMYLPNLDCYTHYKIEFGPLIYKDLKFKGLFYHKCPTAPPKPNFWLR